MFSREPGDIYFLYIYWAHKRELGGFSGTPTIPAQSSDQREMLGSLLVASTTGCWQIWSGLC